MGNTDVQLQDAIKSWRKNPMNEFVPMYKILSEGKSGNFELRKRKVTVEDVKLANLRAVFNPREIPPKVGTVVVLSKKSDVSWRDQDVIMSDAEFEKITNREIVNVARGSVLIAGLGIGMILIPLLKNKKVKKITVVEKEKDVIDLIFPKIKKHDTSNKLKIIHNDIFETELPKEEKFDVIYFDIWDNVCGDNYEQMKNLKKKFRKNRAVGSTILCWQERMTKEQR